MLSYFLHIASFFKLQNFGRLTLMLIGFIALGTVVFRYAEGWSWLDAYYFSVMTLSTVGYGDFNPTTPFTKVFTTVYVLAGLGIILNFVSVFYDHREKALLGQTKKADRNNKETTI